MDWEGLKKLGAITPGDKCYAFYKDMVKKWKANPRWTTAHEIRRHMYEVDRVLDGDDMIAEDLAWQVFFIKYVLPYENKKEEQNGTI